MPAPRLEAEIALKTGGFASGIKSALDGVTNLGATLLRMPGLGPAVAGSLAALAGPAALAASAFKAIGEAADLGTLSKTLGDTVGNVYAIQKAFTAADGTAQGAVGAVTAMQRALGGLNEQGEPTADIFQQIGLNIEALKKQAPTEALLATLDAMKGLDRASQAFATSRIFGRGTGTEALTVLRSGGDARAGFAAAQPTGQIYERTADAADRLLKSIQRIGTLGASLAIPAIEGLIPLFQAAATAVEGIAPTLKAASTAVGEWITAAAQAFAEGDLGNFLWLSIQAGLSKSYDFGVRVWTALGDALANILPAAFDLWFNYWKANVGLIGSTLLSAFETVFEFVENRLGELAKALRSVGLEGPAGLVDKAQVAFNGRANDARYLAGDLDQIAQKAVAKIDITQFLSKALAGFDGAANDLPGAVKVLVDRFRLAAGGEAAKAAAGGGNKLDTTTVTKDRREAPSAIERIGGILNGGTFSPATDAARQTARNTKNTADGIKNVEKRLAEIGEKFTGISFANA